MSAESRVAPNPDMRRRARRTALRLALLAFAIYATFVVFSVMHGHR